MTIRTHHWVCVKCRWSVKQPGICPFCNEWMQDAGANFKTPKKSDNKGWRYVESWIRKR